MNLFTEHNFQKVVDHITENYNPNLPLVLWIDLFCGFGGVAEGYKQVENNFIVAAVNHDDKAIEINMLNHPNTLHHTEDVTDWAVIWKIESLVEKLKEIFPQALIGLHASLECTFFSVAKGGESRDEDSRTLGYHLEKYLAFVPDIITIENVKEFLKWGPVYHVSKTENGKTLFKYKEKNKVYWLEDANHKTLPKFTLPIKERESEDYNKWKKIFTDFGYEYDYRTLNAADFGAFTRRIRYFGTFTLNNIPIEWPKQTHADKKNMKPGLKPWNPVYKKLNLTDIGVSLFGLTKLNKPYSENTFDRVFGGLKKYKNEGYFLSTYYGASKNGQGVYSINDPINTIPCNDRFAIHHIQYTYSNAMWSKMEDPLNTTTQVPKAELITSIWLFDTQFKNTGSSLNGSCPTIIARQDKKPLSIASAVRKDKVDNSIPKEGDSERVLELKAYMREHGIKDIKIRGLYDYELAAAQGFKPYYILDESSSTRSKKFIGNSVCPDQAEANAQALFGGVVNYFKNKIEVA